MYMNGRSVLPPYAIDELLRLVQMVQDVPGDIVEVGAFRCGTTKALAEVTDKWVIALDAFGKHPGMEYFRETSYEDCLEYVKDKTNIQLIQGDICETVKQVGGPLSLVFIDCDLEAPAVAATKYLCRKMAIGALIVYDDPYFEGIARAMKCVPDKFQYYGTLPAFMAFRKDE